MIVVLLPMAKTPPLNPPKKEPAQIIEKYLILLRGYSY